MSTFYTYPELTPDSGATYPRLVAGARSCPPEDCGGVRGYTNLLEILIDPEHEDFEQMRTWVGPRFNAEVFSVAAINQRLKKEITAVPGMDRQIAKQMGFKSR